MPNTFSHPLARQAHVWKTEGLNRDADRILVVITTLETDPNQKGFKPEKLRRLSDAAREWVEQNPDEANDVMLMSRPKAWAGERE